MMRRQLLTPCRNLRLRPSSYASHPPAISHFPPIRLASSSKFYPQSQAILPPRNYSTSTDTATQSSTSEPPPPSNASAAASETSGQDPAKKELEAKNQEIKDLKDRYLRSVADFRNLQDRTQRDINQARQFAITSFARDLMESVDNLDRALATVDTSTLPPSAAGSTASASSGSAAKQDAEEEGNQGLNNLYQGLKMTDNILMQTLKKHGLERFDPKGQKFDPNLHDAAFMTRMEGKEDGVVLETIQKGFTLNGRTIRAAKVGVVKNS